MRLLLLRLLRGEGKFEKFNKNVEKYVRISNANATNNANSSGNNTSNNTNNTSNTTASGTLPYTGKIGIGMFVVALIAIGSGTYLKYNKFKGI